MSIDLGAQVQGIKDDDKYGFRWIRERYSEAAREVEALEAEGSAAR